MEKRMKSCKAILTLLCLVTLFASGCGARKSEQFRAEGDTLLRLGKHQEAQGAYQRALEMNPQNAQALLGAGRCLMAAGKPDEAMTQFEQALAADPRLEAACRELVHVLLRQGRTGDALSWAEKYSAQDSTAGAVLAAYVLRESGKPADAIAKLESVRQASPDNAAVLIELAVAYKDANDLAKAEETVRAFLAQAKQSAAAAAGHLLLADVSFALGKADTMIAEYEKLAQEQPDDAALQLGLTQALLRSGKVDDAEKYARKLHERQPDSGWANYVLGTSLLAKKQYAEAVPFLEKADAALPQQPQVAQSLQSARSGGKAPVAQAPAPAAQPAAATGAPAAPSSPAQSTMPSTPQGIQPLPKDWRGLWKQAAFQAMLEQRAEVIAAKDAEGIETLALAAFFLRNEGVLAELEPSLPEASPVRGYLQAVRARQAEPFFAHMKAWTETDEARVVLRANAFGAGLALLGARFHAMHALTEAAQKYPAYGASYYNLAQVFRAAGSPSVAARVLQKVLPQAVGNMEIHMLLYAALRESENYVDARIAAEMTYSLFPDREDACLNLAQSSLDMHDFVTAESVLKRAEEDRPGSPRIQLAMSRILLFKNQPADALALATTIPDAPDYHDNLASIMVFAQAGLKNWAAVVEQTPDGSNPSTAVPLRMLRATAMVALARTEEAKALLSGGGQANTQWGIADAALGGVSPARQAEAALASALGANQEALTQYLFAMACIALPAYQPALVAFQAAHDTLGGDPVLAGLVAQCSAKALPVSSMESAVAPLLAKYPESGEVQLGLADVCMAVKKVNEEKAALEKAVALAPDLPDAWRRLGGLFEQLSQYDNAIAAYEKFQALRPDDFIANNNLAYCLLLSNKDLDRALACAQRAQAKQPNVPQILHTIGVIQLQRGELDASAQNLRTALALRPADPTLVLDYGKLLLAQGQQEEGLRHVGMSLQYSKQLDLPFPRNAEALALMQQYGKSVESPGV